MSHYEFHVKNSKGYSYTHDRTVLSICSSPNYLLFNKNLGAIVKIDEFSDMDM